jgi:O-antigen/teichoic acid export membrane protein
MIIILARPILTLWVGPEYTSASSLVVILTLASFIATSQWPAGAVLQGMARHRLLAVTALGSGLANLALSIALVRPFGLTGVALGTLVPTAIEFSIILPYTMRVIGISAAEALKEIFLPTLSPAVLMVLVLYILQQVIDPSNLLSIMVVAGTGMIVYAIGYLSIGASRLERQTYRGFAFSMFHIARTHFKRSE